MVMANAMEENGEFCVTVCPGLLAC